jgi:hypothetical protein
MEATNSEISKLEQRIELKNQHRKKLQHELGMNFTKYFNGPVKIN